MNDDDVAISLSEIDLVVNRLKPITLAGVGSKNWSVQYQTVTALNIQSHHNVSIGRDEYVLESLLSNDKLPVLVQHLLCSEIWRENVLPTIIDILHRVQDSKELAEEYKNPEKFSFVSFYPLLSFENTLTNLLELLLFSKDAVSAIHNVITELAEYTVRAIHEFCLPSNKTKENKDNEYSKIIMQMNELNSRTRFSAQISSLSLLRFLSDNISSMPLSVLTVLLDNNDIIVDLAQLITTFRPWERKNGQKLERYEEGDWKLIEKADVEQLNKTEAQVWLSLYNLILDQSCRAKYQVTSFVKEHLLKLRPYMKDNLCDQIPLLSQLRLFLEQLVIIEPPIATNAKVNAAILVEQISEIRSVLLKENNFQELGAKLLSQFWNETKDEQKKKAKEIASSYYTRSFDEAIGVLCGFCGCKATQRCSKCKNEHYCSRECQVAHWKDHKLVCKVVSEDRKQVQTANIEIEEVERKKETEMFELD